MINLATTFNLNTMINKHITNSSEDDLEILLENNIDASIKVTKTISYKNTTIDSTILFDKYPISGCNLQLKLDVNIRDNNYFGQDDKYDISMALSKDSTMRNCIDDLLDEFIELVNKSINFCYPTNAYFTMIKDKFYVQINPGSSSAGDIEWTRFQIYKDGLDMEVEDLIVCLY